MPEVFKSTDWDDLILKRFSKQESTTAKLDQKLTNFIELDA